MKDSPATSVDNFSFIKSSKSRDVDDVLANIFGPRFRVYRKKYKESFDYKNGYEVANFPLTVAIDPVNRCNLDCVMCYTIHHAEKKQSLSETQVTKIMDEARNNQLPALVIGLGAEPLVYKKIRDVIDKAVSADIMDIFLGTNGVLLDESLANFLVDRQIARVEVSIDAASRGTYKAIRGKDQYERVIANVRKLIEVRNARSSELPVVRLCFCVQDNNVHEKEQFLEMWRDVVDYVDFQQMSDFSLLDELRATGTIKDIEELEPVTLECAYPFQSLNVWSDGNVTPCCSFYAKSPELSLGNINESSLKEIWDGEKLAKLRKEIIDRRFNNTCKTCLATMDTDNF